MYALPQKKEEKKFRNDEMMLRTRVGVSKSRKLTYSLFSFKLVCVCIFESFYLYVFKMGFFLTAIMFQYALLGSVTFLK